MGDGGRETEVKREKKGRKLFDNSLDPASLLLGKCPWTSLFPFTA